MHTTRRHTRTPRNIFVTSFDMVNHEDGEAARCSEEEVPSLVPASPYSSPTSASAVVQSLSPSSCGAEDEVVSVSSMSFDPQPE